MRIAGSWFTGAGLRSAPVWIGMAAIAAMSWYYLGHMDGAMSTLPGGASAHAGMAMGGDGAASLLLVFGMWTVMMVAMMVPTVVPSAAVFSNLSARRNPGCANRATASYVAGYITCWIAFAVPAALTQWALTHALFLDPMARSTNAALSSAILLAAGIYQWLPIKRACLSTCRTPLAYLMAHWRDGRSGAFQLGLSHGAYCVGCCWALMAVMFVVGAMSLAWMGLIMLVVLSEKVMAQRWQFDKLVGVVLITAGLWMAAAA